MSSPLRDKIVDLCGIRPMRPKEISEVLEDAGLQPKNLSAQIASLVAQKKIYRDKDGCYSTDDPVDSVIASMNALNQSMRGWRVAP